MGAKFATLWHDELTAGPAFHCGDRIWNDKLSQNFVVEICSDGVLGQKFINDLMIIEMFQHFLDYLDETFRKLNIQKHPNFEVDNEGECETLHFSLPSTPKYAWALLALLKQNVY